MKIICISDLHISTKWIGNLSILDQSINIAKSLIDACKVQDIRHLFICGDIVDKAIDRPEVHHTVQHIFELFSNYFDEIYYILGQHDLAVIPTSFIQITDTILTSMKFPNLHYGNGMILELGGRTIGMANYNRDSSYKLDRNVDLYLTHFTISSRFGQSIDNSKFTYMIAGDIHHPQNIENMYSIGSFQQQSVLRDSNQNCAMIVDLDTLELKRFNINAGLELRHSEIHSGLVDGIWYELKRSQDTISRAPIVSKISEESSNLKIIEIVSSYLSKFNLSEIHTDISNQITNFKGFSTEFKLKYFEVYNFLKLKKFTTNFNDGDLILLTGSNGSGKSTLLNALFSGLTGNITWSGYQGAFDEEVYTLIMLEYGGNLYELRRSSHVQYLKVNNVEVGFKNRIDFPNVVLSHLPFLTDLGILFQRPEVGTLFEGISSSQKLELISKVYNLSYLDALYDTGEKIKKDYVNKSNELNYSIKGTESKLSDLNKKISTLNKVDPSKLELIKERHTELINKQVNALEYNKLSTELLRFEADLNSMKFLVSQYQSELDLLDSDKYEKDLLNLQSLESDKVEIERINSELMRLKSNISNLESELNLILNNKCPRCNQIINKEFIESETSRISELINTLKELYTKEYNRSLELKSVNLNLIPELNKSCSDYINKKSQNTEMIKSLTDKISKSVKSPELMNIPEKVEFTESDLIELMRLSEEINSISIYVDLVSEIDTSNLNLSKLRSDLESNRLKLDELGLYNWYVCKSGPIYKEIISSLCTEWSNDRVSFNLVEGEYRGNPYLDISISYLKGSNWQPYSKSSSGEKSYMDILFIKSVTTNAGMLILDEFLRHMDLNLTALAIEEIKGMNVNLFILSSFNENLYFANKHIKARYIPNEDECVYDEI